MFIQQPLLKCPTNNHQIKSNQMYLCLSYTDLDAITETLSAKCTCHRTDPDPLPHECVMHIYLYYDLVNITHDKPRTYGRLLHQTENFIISNDLIVILHGDDGYNGNNWLSIYTHNTLLHTDNTRTPARPRPEIVDGFVWVLVLQPVPYEKAPYDFEFGCLQTDLFRLISGELVCGNNIAMETS